MELRTMMFIAIIEIGIFTFQSGIHFYWALGGKWGSGAVFPTKQNKVRIAMPGIFPTLTVAFGLLAFGFIVLSKVANLDIEFPHWVNILLTNGLWIIAGIFIIRAVGEFKYVGFLKK